jgi:pyruvate/2-oxoglutarate dehydrogenase complex dihydrolipoamide dehydrogenase (E3) component/uncharacterized membrane protein YdjX (TVP38/TMEM64 family)
MTISTLLRSRWLPFAALLLAIALVLVLDPGRFLTLAYLKGQQIALQAEVAAHPWLASAVCFLIYTAATALCVPGALVMTVAAGAVFGTWWGTAIVSFASTLGATLAFLMARYLFHDLVQARFGHRLGTINRGIAADGPMYLLTLRLIPVIPFIGINLLMALTPISARNFYLYSQLGMLPATLVFVNAGTQFGRLQTVEDLLSPGLLGALGLLALLPLIARFLSSRLRRRRFEQRHPRPPRVERNVIVIGAGSAGLVAAYLARALGAEVTLIEEARMGGDCLNTGCVPSKALLRVARAVHEVRGAGLYGLAGARAEVDFPAVMARVRDVIRAIEPHDSIARYAALGVECVHGRARLISPYTVAVDGRELSARAIVLATGARPLVPALPGLDAVGYLTSETLWDLRELPRRLLILGGGPIGCEMAQAFARLGAQVSLVEMAPRLLPREDAEVGALLEQVFVEEGIALHLHTRAERFSRDDAGKRLHCTRLATGADEPLALAFDEVLLALGRTPRTDGFGLEELGLPSGPRATVDVNDYLETWLPTVYACGDLIGPWQFTHVASHQAWYATVNALFGSLWRTPIDYRVIPWCTFTEPEVARVGLSEAEARAGATPCEVTTYPLTELDRAIADGRPRGFVKVVTAAGTDRILGATVVGAHAGEQIAEFVLAMKHHLGLAKILSTIHVYPTWAEANKYAAGAWRRAHTSPWILEVLARWHRWRREH